MSVVRSSSRSSPTRVSARASGAPGQLWMPRPNARCWRAFLRVGVELVRLVEAARIAVGSAVDHHHRRARAQLVVADGDRRARQPEVALHGALVAQRLLDEVRQQAAVLAHRLLDVGAVAEHLQRRAEQSDRRLLARREDVGGDPRDVAGASGSCRRGSSRWPGPVRMSSRGFRRRSSTYSSNCP